MELQLDVDVRAALMAEDASDSLNASHEKFR
jgi:hypothetical protein